MSRFAALLLLLALLPVYALADLSAWFLDVGQGDCTVIVCDGESMMIDGGPPGASQKVYSFLRDTLALEHLDYMILTHPHEDHAGGLAAALNAVPVNLILSPVLEWNTRAFENVKAYAEAQGAPIDVPHEGDTLSLGGAKVTVLHCWPEAMDPVSESEPEKKWGGVDPENDMSIVVRIDYGQTSLMITGDAESASEYMMMDSQLPLAADVLRIAHHGSKYSTTEAFLSAVSPSYAVISCGEGNQYYHPHGTVLALLKKEGIRLFRTDLQGTVRCVSDGKTDEALFIAPGGE